MSARSAQRLDPLGSLSARALPLLGGAVAFGYALFSTFSHRDQVSHPLLAILALGVLGAAIAVLNVNAMPSRAPFRRGAFLTVLALAMLAAASSTIATWGSDRLVQDDWGQIAFTVLLVSMAQLRPPTEIATAAGVAAVLLGAMVAIPGGHYAIAVGPGIYSIVAATPALALGLGAATYATVIVRGAERWQAAAREGMVRLEPEVREFAARSVHQEQVTALNANATPLFAAVIERGVLTEADIEQAGRAAGELRAHALRLLRGTWLHDVLQRAGTVDAVIDDPDDAIEYVNVDQRAAFGALIVQLARLDDLSGIERARPARPARPARKLQINVAAQPQASHARVVLSAGVGSAPRATARALRPYVAVLRIVARDARLRVRGHSITVGFGYDTV
jgi:hypothetical protein